MNNNFFLLRQKILYLFNAKNGFSIHSPFVFTFYTSVIKRKKYIKSLKKEQLIENIFSFSENFRTVNINIKTQSDLILQTIQKPYTIIILNDIHSDKTSYNTWKNLLNSKGNFISIDFFHSGVLINNPDIKKKQHFILKNG